MAYRIYSSVLALCLLTLSASPTLAEATDDLIAEVAAMAAADGLPAKPMIDKVREGRAKGIPTPRIKQAVMKLRTGLIEARALCGAQADLLCIQAGADALSTGLTPAALTALVDEADAAKTLDRARIFVAVTGLRARGMTPEASVAEVSTALAADRLDALLPAAGAEGAAWAPPAVGRGGELPVQNPTRDRDQTGKGKAWGRGQATPGRPDGAGPPDDRGPPDEPGPPENPGNAGGDRGQD